ncbi:MAG: hypothetical protein A3E32_01780 [Candidatus Zambryskibacteria bacterium RIFCSPHIGHO2_12_FULL_38_37]|uniref:Glycosyltransferase 2-like domain-containing protein n=3 Tax=Candidatus Zambryskiibacteriota TaxID=1817925 RepID=A0A1G2T6U9_9BACT|nr:MAG: hypothetical protein UT81_C0002G0003 [Parcubacteria group bacterium GW2011_GWA2_40_14]OHA93005.1 MAG: hypothetical protein A2W58_02825 [Candidatus Zambryskibacteria bacterium RIFCSPHIGHO2_02_38_10.5]OHA97389.1 MAG: hypothetical protein A3E32_01780 [Candidatus Zambryskibacteria bacterium RIFCSPHIGHO2_12_FULL_38_37]OHB07965.1 MAG: hypothetical protein A2W64_00865 [Candidatus Zambryskibacteria bacterium RIFCSPLOWO2_02_39_10]OHB13502.1 MAG: hypothetical protein A2Y49_00420 [Candidatus Zambr
MSRPKYKKYITPNIYKIFKGIFGKPLRYIADRYETIWNPVPKTPSRAITGWSVVVITDGNNKSSLELFIKSAYNELCGTDYEIIVVGPPKLDLSYIEKDIIIMHVPYKELSLWTVPGAVARKKNFGAKQAKYDKVVLSHDYLVFQPGWKKGYDKFGDFSVCTNVVLDIDGNRHRDWVTWDYPGIGQSLLPYNHECTEYQTIGGNYFAVNRDFFLEHPMNENLRWGEGEDIDWSFSIRNKIKFRMNAESKVQHSKRKTKGIFGNWLEGTQKIEAILKQKTL